MNKNDSSMKTVALNPSASMIETMRRFHEAGASVIKATHTKGVRGLVPSHWNIIFVGPVPDLVGIGSVV